MEFLISVIIPIFNAEKYISKCLESVVNQNFKHLEIICINDGSTDNSLKIIKNFAKKDKRIKIFNTENNGQGSARNLGLKKAKGKYISFIDADDWISKDAYKILYNKSEKFDLDILFFQMINYIDSTKKLVETDIYNYKVLLENFEEDKPFSSYDIEDFLFDISVCPVSKLYKKDFLIQNDISFPENMIFEDNVFFYNSILKANKMSFMEKQYYYRRRHSESITQNISKKSLDIILATNAMLCLFFEEGWYDKFKIPLINHTFSMILEWFFKANLELCDDFFISIKKNFLGFNGLKKDFFRFLNKKNQDIFRLFLKNNNYLDFISEYKYFFISYDNNKCIKENEYKISIVIPIYNIGNLIHRTLMSIINQTLNFEDIEVIFVDDYSKYNTRDILESYENNYSNIKIIYLNENTGSAGTPRNIGLKEASADYIMFLDHDDFFEVSALEKVYDEITKFDADVVFGTYSVIQENKPHDIFYPKESGGYFNNIEDNPRFVGFPPPSIWTKLFKKSFLIDNNILFPPILGEDAIFMNKVLFNASGIVYLKDELICFHDLNKNSTTNNIDVNYLIEGLTSEKYLYDFFVEAKKSYYFKFRCEGNLNFFLSQFLKSNLNKDEITRISPLFNWFLCKCHQFGINPDNEINKELYEYFINEDVNSIYELKIKKSMSKKYYLIFKIFGDKYSQIFKKIYNKIKKLKNK